MLHEIHTRADLDALPAGSVISDDATASIKTPVDGVWLSTGFEDSLSSEFLVAFCLPLFVLRVGDR
jgi:hypothetical protein